MALNDRSTVARALAALALLALLVAAPSRADYKESYRHGVDAVQQKKWDEAIRDLRAAIAEHPDAAGLMGAGLFRRYTPHYFLGVALAEQGDCRAAVDAFDTAERQGKMAHEETVDLQRRRQSCKQKLAAVSDAAAQAQREIDAAAAVAAQVAAVQSSPGMREVWRQGSPSLESRQQAAASRLAGARNGVERAQQSASREQAEEAARAAQQARKELDALLADAQSRRAAAEAEAQRALQEIQRSAESARRDLAFASRTFSPLPPAVAQRAQKVQRALDAVAAADATTPMSELHHRQETLRVALRELRVAIKPPPDELQKAAAAYLGGDYQGTLDALASLPAGDARVAAHACLLRAAALHGIHLLRPDGDARTLEAAKDEIRRCQSLPSPVPPVESAFPPSFRALWQDVAAAAAPLSPPAKG